MMRASLGAAVVLSSMLGAAVVHAQPAEPEVERGAAAGAEPREAPSTAPGAAASEPSEAARNNTPVVSDGPVAVTTRLAPDPSNVGDLLVLEVVAAYPRDVRVNLPTRLAFEPLHHVRTEQSEAEPTGDGLRKTFRIELQHFETGTAQIPAFSLTYVDAEGGVHAVEIPARTFTVESLLVNEDDPQRRGEDPPISREYPDTLTEVVVWSALATLLVALVAWLLLRRLWRRDREVVLPPPIPPHELAFEALDELERGDLLEQGQVQDYFVELTEIAKGYLQGRFGVHALDRTTDEIRQSLLRDAKRLAPLSAEEVVEFLQRCDLVKFARYQPPREESEGALAEVRQMVEATIPEVAKAPEGEPDEVAKDEVAKDEVAKDEVAKDEVAKDESGMAVAAEGARPEESMNAAKDDGESVEAVDGDGDPADSEAPTGGSS